MTEPYFSFKFDFDAIFVVAVSSSVKFFVERLREFNFQGKIILIEDKERPLSELDDELLSQRLTIRADQTDDFIPLVKSFHAPLACVVGWYKILSKDFINCFKSKILNVHVGDLPKYRGVGGGSWQVLNAEKLVKAQLQTMVYEIDRGEVLWSEKENLPQDAFPKDVKEAAMQANIRVMLKLAEFIGQKESLALLPQNEENATYFPRLNTIENGWIDFSWSVEDVVSFVRAFSHPYAGVSFHFGGNIFRVKTAHKREGKINLHPFCEGLIVNITPEALHVVCKGGVVSLRDIHDEDGNLVSLKRFKLGKNISAGSHVLNQAKNF